MSAYPGYGVSSSSVLSPPGDSLPCRIANHLQGAGTTPHKSSPRDQRKVGLPGALQRTFKGEVVVSAHKLNSDDVNGPGWRGPGRLSS